MGYTKITFNDCIVESNEDGELVLLLSGVKKKPSEEKLSIDDRLRIDLSPVKSEEHQPEPTLHDLLEGEYTLLYKEDNKNPQGKYLANVSVVFSSSFNGETTEYDMEVEVDDCRKIPDFFEFIKTKLVNNLEALKSAIELKDEFFIWEITKLRQEYLKLINFVSTNAEESGNIVKQKL